MMITGTIDSILKNKTSDLWSVRPDTTVFDAIKLMAEKNIGSLLVTKEEKLVGILSERDYTRKVALKGKSSKKMAVSEIVSTPVCTVGPDHTVEECLRLMTDKRVRHLPVLKGGKILGVVSIGDLGDIGTERRDSANGELYCRQLPLLADDAWLIRLLTYEMNPLSEPVPEAVFC